VPLEQSILYRVSVFVVLSQFLGLIEVLCCVIFLEEAVNQVELLLN
jgi:hypothetical protein